MTIRVAARSAAAACAAMLLLSLSAAAEEKKAAPKAGPPDQEAMTKAWQAYATPGEPHKLLAKSEGTWIAKTKSWMAPGQPPEETEGVTESKMVLGGRFLEEHFEGKMMGQPFSGIGITGYDNHKKKFEGFWVDSVGTGMMIMSGSLDKTGKKMTSQGKMDDILTGKPIRLRSVMTFVDDDHHTFEMWMTGADGKSFKNLEIAYTRKK